MSNWLLYLVTVLIWGSTWIAIELQLGTVAPEVSIVYRFVLAWALLFAWCAYRGLKLRFDRKAHGYFLMLGAFLFSLNYIATYYAQVYITSAMTAIVFSMMVWMNIINARIFFGTRAGWRVIAGSVLGVSGIVVLFVPRVEEFTFSDLTFFGAALAFTGAFIASLGNMVSQASQRGGLPIVQSNAWGMFYGSILTGAVAFLQGQPFNFEFSTDYVLSLLYLTVFGSILGFGCYLTLLGRIGAHKAGYAMVMFPVVALVISVAFEGLLLDKSILAGVTLALAGNMLILRGAKQDRHRIPSQPDDERPLRLATERLQ